MKHWLNQNFKTLIIAAFLIPIITVAIVSISHVTKWYGISNPVSWAVYLSIGIEIAALSALAAISANMGKKVYFPFAVVTLIQFIGNVFFAYTYIDINGQSFRDWVDLVLPLTELMGVDSTDLVGNKRFLAFFAGGMLPIISLSFLHMLVKFTEEDRLKENETPPIKESESNPEDLKNFIVKQTYINGKLVAAHGKSFIPFIQEASINQFDAAPITESAIQVTLEAYPTNALGQIPVIEAIDGQLITNCLWMPAKIQDHKIVSNTKEDVLKMVVYNRYFKAPPKMAFIKNFGFQHGAIASTVAHDSHNIIAVGVDDACIVKAINLVIEQKGGISCVNESHQKVLGLPVGGLMSNQDPYIVAQAYTEIDQMAKSLGSPLGSPFMTLSFMALLVIPHLKLSDKGLFDGDGFKLF
jgi:hypothetical protein